MILRTNVQERLFYVRLNIDSTIINRILSFTKIFVTDERNNPRIVIL